MIKPAKVARYAYNYNDLIDYLEEKHKIQTSGYKRKHDKEYRDFWHWLLNEHWFGDVANGTYQTLNVNDILSSETSPWWVKEIVQIIFDEYGFDEMKFFVEW